MDDFLLTPDRDLCIKMRIQNPDPHYNVCGSNSPLAEPPPPPFICNVVHPKKIYSTITVLALESWNKINLTRLKNSWKFLIRVNLYRITAKYILLVSMTQRRQIFKFYLIDNSQSETILRNFLFAFLATTSPTLCVFSQVGEIISHF